MMRTELDALRRQLAALPAGEARQMLRMYETFIPDCVGDSYKEGRT